MSRKPNTSDDAKASQKKLLDINANDFLKKLQTPYGLTWDDWCYTTSHKIALRHHDRSLDAQREQMKGSGTGDSCSLVIKGLDITAPQNSMPLIAEELQNRLNSTGWCRANKPAIIFINEFLSENTSFERRKECLTAAFNLMLRAWIEINDNEWPSVEHDYLIIIHPDAHKAHDFESYPLGKCGKEVYAWEALLRIHLIGPEHKSYITCVKTVAGAIKGLRLNHYNPALKPVVTPTILIDHKAESAVKHAKAAASASDPKDKKSISKEKPMPISERVAQINARINDLEIQVEKLSKDLQHYGVNNEQTKLISEYKKVVAEYNEYNEYIDHDLMPEDPIPIPALDKLESYLNKQQELIIAIERFNFIVDKGQFTFDVEGQEGGPLHSRIPHVPGQKTKPAPTSGITIGRGYDLGYDPKSEEKYKLEKKKQVMADLTAAGLDSKDVKAYVAAAGYRGEAAVKYLAEHKAELVEITPAQQKRLFEITYARHEENVNRICCRKADTVAKYGATNWEKLNQKIKDVLIDLCYRGDYTGSDTPSNTRSFLQPHVVANNLAEFTKVLSDRKWLRLKVPLKRFQSRVKHLQSAPLQAEDSKVKSSKAAGTNSDIRNMQPLSNILRQRQLIFIFMPKWMPNVSTESIPAYEIILKKYPNNIDVLFEYGCALNKLNRFEEALGIFNNILALQMDHEGALHMHGFILRKLDKLDEALVSCHNGLRVHKDSIGILHNRGVVYFKLGFCEAALTDFDRVLQLQPNCKTLSRHGEVLSALGRREEALANYRQTLLNYEQSLEEEPNNLELLCDYGHLLYTLGRNNKALQVFRLALEVQPNDERALNNCGVMLMKVGHTEEALTIFTQLHEAYPNDRYARNNFEITSAKVMEMRLEQMESKVADQKDRVNVAKTHQAMPKSPESKHHSVAATNVASLVRNIHRFHTGAATSQSVNTTSRPQMDLASFTAPMSRSTFRSHPHQFRRIPKVHNYEGFSYSQEKPQLVGMLNEQKVVFDHYEAKADGRCGFYSIGVYGEGDHFHDPVIHTLLAHADKPEVRASLANEIANEVAKEFNDDSNEDDKIWSTDVHLLLLAKCFFDEQEDAKQPVENKAYKDLIEACKHPDVYRKYVNHFRQRSWLGCYSAKIVAQYCSRPFNLYIWEADSANLPNGIKIKDSYVNPGLADVKHIFFTNGTHFDFLVMSPNQHSTIEVKSSTHGTSSDAKKAVVLSDNKTAVAAMGTLGITAAAGSAAKTKDSKVSDTVKAATSMMSFVKSSH